MIFMQITFEEFQQYIAQKEKKIAETFSHIDLDHSGKISASDLVSTN